MLEIMSDLTMVLDRKFLRDVIKLLMVQFITQLMLGILLMTQLVVHGQVALSVSLNNLNLLVLHQRQPQRQPQQIPQQIPQQLHQQVR